MRILHFDSVGGASGDMILGALADLGLDLDALRNALGGLAVEHLRIDAHPCKSRGLTGTRITVSAEEDDHGHPHADRHGHGHNEPHSHHLPHRGLREIRGLVEAGDLPETVRATAMKVFERIAEAEAKIHGTTPDRIHFHEIGALDSIADIVGGCFGLHRLGIDAVSVGPLPLGSGTIECAHGTYPCPAPATLELLRGHPVVQTDEPFELVTPTGAGLLMTWKSLESPPAGAHTAGIGYGFGHRGLKGRPNVLRARLMESEESTDADACLVLECNLDDATPEWIGVLADRALKSGALDAFSIPAQMKKQRPGVLFTVLCRPGDRDRLIDLVFKESTTFGIREYEARRTVLERTIRTVATPYGDIRVKFGLRGGVVVTRSPEMDDCVRASEAHGVAARVVYEAAARAAGDVQVSS